jgi:hypothetical protein
VVTVVSTYHLQPEQPCQLPLEDMHTPRIYLSQEPFRLDRRLYDELANVAPSDHDGTHSRLACRSLSRMGAPSLHEPP